MRELSFAQRFEKNIGCRHGILNGEIDTDTADRRHGVGGVADAQKTRPKPVEQSVHADRQKLYIVPAAQLLHAVARVGRELHDRRAKSFERLPAHLVELSLGNDVAALPIVAAIERDENPAGYRTCPWSPRDLPRFVCSRNQSTSIGAPNSFTGKPAFSRTIELRPSAPTTRSARTSISPLGVFARTPTTRPDSSIRPVTSASIIKSKLA